jgi:hypothetical protein
MSITALEPTACKLAFFSQSRFAAAQLGALDEITGVMELEVRGRKAAEAVARDARDGVRSCSNTGRGTMKTEARGL